MRQFYQMSPIDNNSMPGVRGKKTPGKPGRFDPSEPLHMTTRRAANKPTTNGSPSMNGSADDSDSRRGSLDDLRPLTSHSNGSQISVKSRRLSGLSVVNVTPDNHMNGIQSSEENQNGRSVSNPASPIQQTPSPSRKRKRSSTPPDPPSAEQLNESTEFGSYESGLTFADDGGDGPGDYAGDDAGDESAVEVVRPDDLSDPERPASQESYESEDATQGDVIMAEASMDATPAISEPVSPATSESRSQEDALIKPLDAALEKISQAAADEPEDQDEVDDVIDVGEEVEADEIDEVDEQADDDDGRPRRGRFGGRRRARHPNPDVEKAMQRQAELKSAYRSIARAQKTVLAEIAQRTIDDLKFSPQLHSQALEYDHVRSGLDKAHARRHKQLQAQQELNMQQLNQTLEGEQQMLRMICNERLAELKEDMLVQLEHKMLSIAREAQLAEYKDGYETEDEDDVVPRLKRTGYKFTRSGPIEDAYDSRSRPTIEIMRATSEMEGRFNMHRMLKDLEDADKTTNESGFTVMDSARRELAEHKRISVQNTDILAAAAKKKESIIPNEKAHGLQVLADTAARPSVSLTFPPPLIPSKSRRESMVDQSPSRPMPPLLHLQTQYGPSSIPVEMSPRTTQAMGDRFDTTMPPPMTPRQSATSYIHSPDANRMGFPAMSPTVHTPRLNGQSTRRLSDSRPEPARRGLFPTFNSPQDHLDGFPERRPDIGAAPFRAEERRYEMPGWREFPPNQPPPSARRTSFNNERTSFTFSQGVIPGGERDRVFGPRSEERRDDADEIKSESSPYHPSYRSSAHWPEPSQPGAADGRQQDQRSPALADPPRHGWRPLNLAPRSPTHSRHNSLTSSVHDRRRDSEGADRQQRPKDNKAIFQLKSSKAERGGLPRRHWSKEQKKHSKSLDKPASASSPTLESYASSPVERAPPQPAPWGGPQPPMHSPIGPPPPTAMFQPPSVSYGQPHTQYSPPGHDFYHRNSFPPQHQHQPSPASIWNQPQSHLYAVPQHPHPPPPGVPSEHYSRFAPPPPPPPSYQPPPPPHSAPISYSNQFGGPPLAPATANPGFHPSGIRPSQPPPAFAQQAQQQQGSSGRQRARSDASNLPKFHAYHPPRR